jgi:site-specific DNA recombinase
MEDATIETQKHVLEEFVLFLDYEVVGRYFDEGVTSSVPVYHRPEGHRLLEDAKQQRFDTVLVYRIDRVSRYREVFYDFLRQLKELEIGLRSRHDHFETESPSGRLMLNILLDFAEYERDSIAQRTLDGRERVALQNAHLGGVPRYGYRVEGHKPRYLVAHETVEDGWAEAELVRLAFTLASASGDSCLQIARQYTAMGIPIPRAARCRWWRGQPPSQTHGWSHTMIAGMFKDTTYYGEQPYTLRGRTILRQVPPLITREVWEAARVRVDGHRKHHGPAKRQYLLAGKIRCGAPTDEGGECGYSWSGCARRATRPRRDGSEAPERRYYACLAHHSPSSCGALHRCSMPQIRAERLEEQVWSVLMQHLLDLDATMLRFSSAQQSEEEALASMRRRRDAVLQQRERLQQERIALTRLMTKGASSEEEGILLLGLLRQEMDSLQEVLSQIVHEEEALTRRAERSQRVRTRLEAWRERLSGPLVPEDRRQAVMDLVDEIRLVPTESEVEAHCYLLLDPPGVRSHTVPSILASSTAQ